MRVGLVQANGEPGILVTAEGRPIMAIVLEVTNGVVQAVQVAANPDKLLGVRAVESS